MSGPKTIPPFIMPPVKHLRVDIIVQRLEHISEVLDLDPDIFRWIAEQVAPEAYAPELAIDHRPCLHPPGSPEKIAALKRRWAKDLGLWNADDGGHSQPFGG